MWEPVNGRTPGGPAASGEELVTVKEPAQADGLVVK